MNEHPDSPAAAPLLAGRVVLVTGGADGIGHAVAEFAQACGARVAIADIRADAVHAAAGRLGNDAIGIVADVSDEADCDAAVGPVIGRWGRLDVLVNNAGIAEPVRRTTRQDLADWRRVIDVNLQGTYLMARAAARAMIAARTPGAIVNLSSITGLVGFRASNAYGVSKAAVAMLTRTLATDLASARIRVNAVAPGIIDTAMSGAMVEKTRMPVERFERRITLGRLGRAEEIARTVVFLASDWASYITGAVLPVDGGWCAFGGPGDASADTDPGTGPGERPERRS